VVKLIKLATFLIAIISLSFATGCAQKKASKTFASSKGFVKEFDEPSVRGVLQRISPEGVDVRRKYAISPDGESIVVSAAQTKVKVRKTKQTATRIGQVPLDLWKISKTGGAPIKITSSNGSDCLSPSFTSDGKFIVFESGGTIWKVRSDGAGARTRLPATGLGYDNSPDVCRKNNKIVFVTSQRLGKTTANTIWTTNLHGGELTQIREGNYPRWSPDGKKIAFEFRDDIWLISADGTDLTQLTNTQKVVEGIPSFSKDGKQIAYVSNEGDSGKPLRGGDYNIWVMNIDGTQKQQLTELGSWDSWPQFENGGVYFLSGRAAANKAGRVQRLWHIKINE